MLDKLTLFVLNKINVESNGSFVVIDIGDFISALPRNAGTDESAILNAVSFLNSRGYIDLKYSDGSTLCVCSMPKGRQLVESDKPSDNTSMPRTLFITAFAGGLLGAVIGGITAAVLSTLLW